MPARRHLPGGNRCPDRAGIHAEVRGQDGDIGKSTSKLPGVVLHVAVEVLAYGGDPAANDKDLRIEQLLHIGDRHPEIAHGGMHDLLGSSITVLSHTEDLCSGGWLA